MSWFRKYFLLIFSLLLLIACSHKKKKLSLAGDEPVGITDFIDFFPTLKLSYQVGDTVFNKKEKDSLLISYKVFTQFVPDSVLTKSLGKGANPTLYPVGKIVVPKAEKYFLLKVLSAKKKMLLLICLNEKDSFITSLSAMQPDIASNTSQSLTIDKKLAIIKTTTRRNKDGTVSEGKDVYALDAQAKKFTLVMTDPLDDKISELINPIDTLTRKSKYTADYGTGKMNLVSIRDGRKPDRVSFFIHFEKNKGACTGELKGEAFFKKPNMAEYRENGESCVLQFIFSNAAVTLKEVEGCGSRRGMNCSFDDVYAKKKLPKATSKKSK